MEIIIYTVSRTSPHEILKIESKNPGPLDYECGYQCNSDEELYKACIAPRENNRSFQQRRFFMYIDLRHAIHECLLAIHVWSCRPIDAFFSIRIDFLRNPNKCKQRQTQQDHRRGQEINRWWEDGDGLHVCDTEQCWAYDLRAAKNEELF